MQCVRGKEKWSFIFKIHFINKDLKRNYTEIMILEAFETTANFILHFICTQHKSSEWHRTCKQIWLRILVSIVHQTILCAWILYEISVNKTLATQLSRTMKRGRIPCEPLFVTTGQIRSYYLNKLCFCPKTKLHFRYQLFQSLIDLKHYSLYNNSS